MAQPPATLPPGSEPGGGDLLSTKLHMPQLPAGFVRRPRLVARLDAGPGGGVALVCAGAGFGKSVLVADWCRRTRDAVAWLSLDAGDNDPVRFWRHAAAALDRAHDGPAGIVARVDRAIAGSAAPEAVVIAVLNVVAALPAGVVLVLDDYHLIDDEAVHASVRFLIAHAPSGLRVVVVSRADPPLLLARARARGVLTELRERELRFTATEAAALLRAASRSDVPDDAAAALTDRTEGWAAGLQLAGLSLRGDTDAASFVTRFSGSHRFVGDYLTEEVLDRQSPTVREFLLQTSVLQRLSGSVCDAVTGRTDSQALLEEIERAGLFLVPLDDVRGWWRYHHLFAELLRVRLGRRPDEEVRDLHRRAAIWHEAHELTGEVVNHALRADDAAWAARVIERHADELLLRREGATLQRSLAELPAGVVDSRRLLLTWARVALYGGRVGEAEQLLAAAEGLSSDGADTSFVPSVDRAASPLADPDPMTALLHAFVAHLRGDVDEAAALASRTLDEIDDEQSALALIARLHLAAADWFHGSMRDAEVAVAANVAGWRAARAHDRAAWAAHYLGRIQQDRGRLNAVVETYQQVLARDAAQTGADAPVAGIAHIGLAQVAYQRNDLDQARHHASEGVARCRQFVYTQPLATGLATLARICQASGDETAARDAITEAIDVGPDADVVDLLNPVPAERAKLLLAWGDVDAAAAWVGERGLDAHDEPTHVHEPAYLVLARVLIAHGRPTDAVRVLERLRAAATADGRTGSRIEIAALRALALAATDDQADALPALAHAVLLAAPQKHVRVFVDEGRPMAELLGALVAAPATAATDPGDVPLAYVGLLARSFDDGVANGPALDTASRRGLVAALTDRELEVLRLVATGKRNKQIAAELYVTLNTVKKHVTHIFDKLGATNRTAAVDRARELDLLP